jgi:membrane-bound lytic murein transglycosylase D
MNDPAFPRLAAAAVALLIFLGPSPAQEIPSLPDLPDLEDFLGDAREWIDDNLDQRVAQAIDGLEEPSPDTTRAALREIQREFGGDHILDIIRIRRIAELLLPLLEEFEETADQVPWLRTRLDYIDVADDLARLPLAPPPATDPGTVTIEPGRPPPVPNPPKTNSTPALPKPSRPSNPPAALQRQAWQRAIGRRTSPPAGAVFVDQLKPIFIAAGAPAELVWLAEVESSFNPDATSPAGAVGLFQLMPATARSLGLSTTLPDERRHPARSARAAATYLARLHRRFGDWRLALAAYNAGEGRIRRTLDQRKATTFDEISPHLPAETQFYVPKFEAVLRQRESRQIEDLAPPIPSQPR